MKKLIKKVSAVVAAMALMTGVAVVSNASDVYASQTVNVTVNFTPANGENVSDYNIKLSTNFSGEVGPEEFTSNTYEWKFTNKAEGQDDVETITYYIKKNNDDAMVKQDSVEVALDATEATIDIDLSDGTATTTETTVASVEETTAATDTTAVETTVATASDDSVAETVTEAVDREDDKTKDYSVKPVAVIALDLLILVALGGTVYYFAGKEKKELKK